MKPTLSFEVLLLRSIDLSHIHNSLRRCFVPVCSDIYIKERLGTFLFLLPA